jgi:hypothetical protein
VAFVGEFQEVGSDRNGLHKPVLCGWRTFNVDGQTILQLDTYGSDQRQIPNKVSQSFQVNRESAAILLQLIRETFRGL